MPFGKANGSFEREQLVIVYETGSSNKLNVYLSFHNFIV